MNTRWIRQAGCPWWTADHSRRSEAPVRDRLQTMLFLAALLHGLIIVGITFGAAAAWPTSAPGLEVLLVANKLPEAAQNPAATYLAQRTQQGSGNTPKAVAPRIRRPRSSPSITPARAGTGTAEPGSRPRASGERGGSREQCREPAAVHSADNAETQAPREQTALLIRRPGPPIRQRRRRAGRPQGPQCAASCGSPRIHASPAWPYLDAWRRKVERIGTLNYPNEARRPAVREPGGGSGDQCRRASSKTRGSSQSAARGAGPGGACDPEARHALRSVPAGAAQAARRRALRLRMAVPAWLQRCELQRRES